MKNYVRLAAWALACLIFGSVSTHAQNITTVVGGGPGAIGLPATSTSVGSPVAVRFDSNANMYVLDNTFGRVLKVTSAGVITTYAGNGTSGFSGDGGPAINAQFNQPSGMCIDTTNGNLYIADSDNAVIRVVIGPSAVTPFGVTGPVAAGNIYTVVGVQTSTNPIYGGDGGAALSAHLHFPDGCALDSKGDLFIADRGNNEIRVVLSTTGAGAPPFGITGPFVAGNIYKYAGGNDASGTTPPTGGYAADGSAANGGKIYGPFDVLVDSSDNVFFTDLGNNFTPGGTPDQETGNTIPNNNVVREITGTTGIMNTVAGLITTVAGVPTGQYTPAVASGPAVGTAVNEPKGLSIDGAGNLYFCDAVNQVIRKVTTPGVAGSQMTVVAGTLGHSGFSGDGHAATSATLTYPAGSFIDPVAGVLYIADVGSNAVRIVPLTSNVGSFLLGDIYTLAGNGHLSFGGDTAVATAGELNTPASLAVDAGGDIFVADSQNDLIREVAKATGKLSTIAGQPEANGFLNSPIFINGALGVATDASGNVYIADTTNCLIRKVSSAGITTIAGVEPAVPVPDDSQNAPVCGFGAAGAPAVATKIGAVNSVAVDSHGNVFFSDGSNNVVWEVPAVAVGPLVAGDAYIVAGTTAGAGFSGDGGPALAAQLSAPTGIYIDIYNNLFIADSGNHRIREVPAVNVTTPTAMTAGSIYTIAGNGTSGDNGDGAAATSAEIATPYAVVVDHAENVFFSDTTNQTVRKITYSTGNINTVAGTKGVAGFSGDGGAALSATLNVPRGLGLYPDAGANTTSDLLISDSNNNRVRSVAALASNAAVPLASLNPTTVTFAAEPVGTPSTAMAVTLTNGGGATLTVTGITKGGTNAGDFSETDNCTTPGTVAAGGTCTINVTFTPTALGARTATLTVADSAFGGTQSITLNGTGGSPTADLSPTSLTFTGTTVGKTSAAQTVTLTNNGNVATVVTGVTITGTNAADFAVSANTCGAPGGIAPTLNCTIAVTFVPSGTSTETATLNIADNVGAGQTVALSGTGVAATLSLTLKDTDASSTQTVTAGATATYNLSLSGNQSVTATITCTGAPTDATCSATPASVPVTAAAAGTFKVTITTTARSQMVPFNQPSMKIQPPTFLQVAPLASLALLFVIAMMLGWMQDQAGRARTLRLAMSLCLILMPIVASTVLVGCGGGSSSSTPPPAQTGTPAGTYAITVTATSGSTNTTAALTLVVN